MTRKDGGPAFPQEDYPDRDAGLDEHPGRGMSLRDYFAAHAPPMPDGWEEFGRRGLAPLDKVLAARWAYAFADAMLAERGKGK